jgi:hypothetical protein
MIRKVLILFLYLFFGLFFFATFASAQTTIKNDSIKGNQVVQPNFVPVFNHIFIIFEENKNTSNIKGNEQAPFLNSLMNQYAVATNYFAIEHPSLPNYMDMLGGNNGGIGNRDCEELESTCVSSSTNLMDRIDGAGLTWKAYFESMPNNCGTIPIKNYDLGVNPFVHYKDILYDKQRCYSHVLSYDHFSNDLENVDKLAYLNFIAPNMCNNMHNCSIETGDNWLTSEVGNILKSKAFTEQDSLLIITWDESEYKDSKYNFSNNVPLLLVGPAVKHAYRSNNHYDHFSLLHTIEAAWRLQSLTENDKNSPIMNEFFSSNRPTLELL